MEAPFGNLVNEAKNLEKRVEEQRQQTKSLESLVEDSSAVSGFAAADIEAFHRRSMHDINLCIEKIEELSTECKSLLSVIQDLERGSSDFLAEVKKKRNSEIELENSLVRDFEAFSAEAEIDGRKTSAEAFPDNSSKKTSEVGNSAE